MNIDEATKARLELQLAILELIRSFEDTTELSVSDIRQLRLHQFGRKSSTFAIEIIVELP